MNEDKKTKPDADPPTFLELSAEEKRRRKTIHHALVVGVKPREDLTEEDRETCPDQIRKALGGDPMTETRLQEIESLIFEGSAPIPEAVVRELVAEVRRGRNSSNINVELISGAPVAVSPGNRPGELLLTASGVATVRLSVSRE